VNIKDKREKEISLLEENFSVSNQRFIAAQMRQISREEWNDVVLKAEEGTFFHTYDWSKVLADYGRKEARYRPRHILIKDQETDRLVGILPLLLTRKHRLISLPYGDYGGPCIDQSVNRRDVLEVMFNEVEEIAKEEARITFLKSLPREYLDWLCLRGYTKTPENYTFILSIRHATLDSLWRKFERSPRQCVRRAQKKGVTVEEAVKKDLMKEYYNIHVETMKRLGALVRPFLFFEILWDVLAKRGLMKLFLAKYEGKYIAGIIAFPWKRTLHLYANASLKEYQKLGSNYILCYAAIEWAFKHNFDIDFGLSPLNKNSGLYQFKKRWGGTPRLLFSASKNYSIITNLLLSIWLLRKSLSRRLPKNVKRVAKMLRR
jgi:predicted N-acyltransferase